MDHYNTVIGRLAVHRWTYIWYSEDGPGGLYQM